MESGGENEVGTHPGVARLESPVAPVAPTRLGQDLSLLRKTNGPPRPAPTRTTHMTLLVLTADALLTRRVKNMTRRGRTALLTTAFLSRKLEEQTAKHEARRSWAKRLGAVRQTAVAKMMTPT